MIKGLFEGIHEFFSNAHLPKAISYAFIALIPKNHNPQEFIDYRPICLIEMVYWIILKLLAGG